GSWPNDRIRWTAQFARHYLDRTATAVILIPDRTWQPDPTGFRAITDLLADLTDAALAAPTPLHTLVDDTVPSPRTSLTHPDDAEQDELSADRIAQLRILHRRITILAAALSAADAGPDPADLLQPLDDALLVGLSHSLSHGLS